MKSNFRNFYLAAFLLLPITLVTSCGGEDDDGGVVPPSPSTVVANFSSQVDADNSLTYNFTNSSVVNGITDRSFASSWDFGDGNTSSEASPSHTYTDEGDYTVTLTVTASDGVTGMTSEMITVTAPKNRYAVITDTDPDDTGELRLALTDSIMTGRVTFMYRFTEGPMDMDIQDGFINVSGRSTTGDFALVEVRLKDNAPHGFREGASDDAIAAAMFPEGMADVWVPVEVSWAADGMSAPTFSLSIDGQTIITDAVSTTNGGAGDVDGHLAAVIDGAFNFQWKYAGNSAVSDGMYHVDDIVIYSSDSGMEAIVFEDDFQGRTAGDNLDSEENEDSPYHPNSTDVTVGEDD